MEDDLKLIGWNDEQLGGKGFVDWYPFDHPQLGRVELGGWTARHERAGTVRTDIELVPLD